jgi:hypothetical protein
MALRRLGLALATVVLLAGSMLTGWTRASADGPEVQAASTVNANVQIRSTFTTGPGGGRLKITVKNFGPDTIQYAGVGSGGLLPSQLRFAGPDAAPTIYSCSNALAAGDTTCPVANSYGLYFFVTQTLRIDSEQMLVTAASSTDITLVRGINGTTATSHVAGTQIYFMRPRVTASGGATSPYCAVGVGLAIACQVTTLPPGGKMTIVVDLQVDPATPNGTKLKINLTMDGYPSGQITPIPGVIRLKVYNHDLVATRLWQYP